jgi:hypothetical protein
LLALALSDFTQVWIACPGKLLERIGAALKTTGESKSVAQKNVSLADEGNKPASRRTDEVQFKGMIEIGCGNFAVMIDKATAHYGWTFQRNPDGMWVSGRVATPAEMQTAIAHARFTTLKL